MIRFAVVVTLIELALTAGASVLVTYTEAPAAFATQADLEGLSIPFTTLEHSRSGHQNASSIDTKATLASPAAALYVSLRPKSTATDLEFRRAREESQPGRPDRGEISVANEPLPGEKGYAVRHRAAASVRFELVRLRGDEMLIVRVVRQAPYDLPVAAELSRCERRARVIQEQLMIKMRWRD